MRLTDEEKAMLDGEMGEPRRWALDQQIQVGEFFDAESLVEVTQAHIMCDTESLGEEGVMVLEYLAGQSHDECQVRIPTLTDPRGMDFNVYRQLKQESSWADLERRTIEALTTMGVLMTDTCINYQTVSPAVFGEHLAYGDTGVVIYTNSVLGARSNFEGGPAALAAALTGRAPRYGLHLPEKRRGTRLFNVKNRPLSLSDWGALGAIIGRQCQSYWSVPVIDGISLPPTSDELKHFGAALASYGSVPMFHMVGVTPEARSVAEVFDDDVPEPEVIGSFDIQAFYYDFDTGTDKVDVVVFAAPQLSLLELKTLAGLLEGQKLNASTAMLICTNPENKEACDRLGLSRIFEESGAILLKGVCFYQMRAREMGEAMGWQHLLTNSAKLANIIGGYGYKPRLATMEQCVEAGVTGSWS